MDQCLNQSLLYRKNQENQEIAWFFTKTYKVIPCFFKKYEVEPCSLPVFFHKV